MIGIALAGVLFVAGSLLGKRSDDKAPDVFPLGIAGRGNGCIRVKEGELMKECFIDRGAASQKFWAIDYGGLSLCVHYGRIGTIGRFELKEFDDEELCASEAKRLIADKLKQGYLKDAAFDFEQCIYIDVEEYGPHRKTSHPRFVEAFSDDFYYDCADEEAPFGSDEGADTLSAIEEKLRKNAAVDFPAFPAYLIEEEWGMRYIAAAPLDEETVIAMTRQAETDMRQSDMVTYAAAFAQIKTTGKAHPALKRRALAALKRNATMYANGELTGKRRQMYDDLSRFQALE